jgi:hypothetical protein
VPDKNTPQRLRTGPDIILLVAGLITLATAASLVTGGFGNVQWTLTGTAVGIGAVLLLLSSLWQRR